MYVFRHGPLPIELRNIRVLIPGAINRGSNIINAPDNCAWLVEDALTNVGVQFNVFRSEPSTHAEFPTSRLQPWVPDWLMDFQKDGVAFALPKPGAFLRMPAGSGKSATAISWAVGTPGKTLWITRAVSKRQHRKEIERLTTSRVQIVDGVSAFEFDPACEFVVINWEILVPHWERLARHGFRAVVFDESQKAKAAKRWIAAFDAEGRNQKFIPANNISFAASKLSRAIPRRIALSATPIKNRVCDLWAQLDLINPGEWGSRADWMVRYAGRHTGTFGQIDDRGATNLGELKERLGFSFFTVPISKTHKSLPPLRRQTVYISADELLSESDRSTAKAIAGQGPIEGRIAIAAARKRKAVQELVVEAVEAGQHVTVFTNRKEDCEELAKRLSKQIECPIYMIHGETPMDTREEYRENYLNATGAAVIVATGYSIGEAIDLNKTDLAIMAALPYTGSDVEQWEKRFWRLGQDRPVLIVYTIAVGTIDEHIAAIILDKLPPMEHLTEDDDAGDIRRQLLGGKSSDVIQKELMSMILESEAA